MTTFDDADLDRRRNKQLALASISTVPLSAWSTDDLIAERTRVRSVLDQAPPDRSADLRSLGESRRDNATRLREHQESLAALECRKRPRRERRQPDFELIVTKRNLAYFDQQAERLDREIAALHSSQHRRASHLAAHRTDTVALDEIGKALAERLREQTTRVVQDPPSYIVKILGTRPADRTKDRAWVRAIVEIERFRLDHRITDGRSAIGTSPSTHDLESVHAWRRASYALADAREVLAPSRGPMKSLIQRVDSPSLGIEL